MFLLLRQSFFLSLVTTPLLILSLTVGYAQVRSSASYLLQSDSVNIGGGYSTSTSYVQESTVGEIATGRSTSTSYQLRAGYQQMQEVFISLSNATEVVMTPSLPGITGGTSNGSTTVTVITDSPSGYQLTIEGDTSPAMQNSPYSIPDYDAGAEPDYSFVVTAGTSSFGYSPSGADVVAAFLDNGATLCSTGSNETALACWDGLTASPVAIAQGSGPNQPSGATTTIYFRVGVGSNANVIAGEYIATSTLTALPL